jgi:hypothetical protein
MKATCLLFLSMSCVALTHGTGYAVPWSPDFSARAWKGGAEASPLRLVPTTVQAWREIPSGPATHPTGGQASAEQRDYGRASYPNHSPNRPSLTKANRPKQLPNSRQRSLPGNALHRPGSDKSGGAAKSGFIRNETIHNALPVRTPSVVRPAVPLPNNVRHRGPNPAVVGGSPNSQSRNTGAINGTRINRKP